MRDTAMLGYRLKSETLEQHVTFTRELGSIFVCVMFEGSPTQHKMGTNGRLDVHPVIYSGNDMAQFKLLCRQWLRDLYRMM